MTYEKEENHKELKKKKQASNNNKKRFCVSLVKLFQTASGK